ncbi:hypothetical protein VP01_4362g1 [Puccinia sorghi]|uniref:Uncharacterized protein n=1 Tax=Puccinia sorghi TaxID=27349 RepID=A0A0L6URS7_9BASI|nr:hypothetical protein VP01_4362g1 [Puccinia sorghi]
MGVGRSCREGPSCGWGDAGVLGYRRGGDFVHRGDYCIIISQQNQGKIRESKLEDHQKAEHSRNTAFSNKLQKQLKKNLKTLQKETGTADRIQWYNMRTSLSPTHVSKMRVGAEWEAGGRGLDPSQSMHRQSSFVATTRKRRSIVSHQAKKRRYPNCWCIVGVAWYSGDAHSLTWLSDRATRSCQNLVRIHRRRRFTASASAQGTNSVIRTRGWRCIICLSMPIEVHEYRMQTKLLQMAHIVLCILFESHQKENAAQQRICWPLGCLEKSLHIPSSMYSLRLIAAPMLAFLIISSNCQSKGPTCNIHESGSEKQGAVSLVPFFGRAMSRPLIIPADLQICGRNRLLTTVLTRFLILSFALSLVEAPDVNGNCAGKPKFCCLGLPKQVNTRNVSLLYSSLVFTVLYFSIADTNKAPRCRRVSTLLELIPKSLIIPCNLQANVTVIIRSLLENWTFWPAPSLQSNLTQLPLLLVGVVSGKALVTLRQP